MAISDGIGNFGAAVDLFGGAAGSLFSASGYAKEAAAYGTAAAIAASNAELEGKNLGLVKESTAIQDRQLRVNAIMNKLQQAQQERKTYQILGATNAAISASGQATGGSSLDILRSNTMQAHLDEAMVRAQGNVIEEQRAQNQKQGEINLVNVELQQKSFLQQSAAYLGEQGGAEAASDAAKASAGAKGAGGILSVVSGVFKLFGL